MCVCVGVCVCVRVSLRVLVCVCVCMRQLYAFGKCASVRQAMGTGQVATGAGGRAVPVGLTSALRSW